MTPFAKMTIAIAAMAGGALIGAAPANAQVDFGIHVPDAHASAIVSTPAFSYGPVYYPPGPCDGYNYYYQGDCGYAVYNGPIELDGVAIGGPHFYRWFNGRPWFWYRGGWHNWNGWTQVNFGWDHGEGWGWHGGHWDRGWGNDHWHGSDGSRHVRYYTDDRGERGHRGHEEDHHER